MIKKIQETINKRKQLIEFDADTIVNEIKVGEDEFQMFELKCKLLDKFTNLKAGEFDCFVLQMLKLAKMMIQFEFITMEVSEPETRICKRHTDDFTHFDLYRLLSAIKNIFETPQSGINKGMISNKNESLMESQILNKRLNFEISEEPFANYLEGVQKYIQFQSDRVEKKKRINMKNEELKNGQIPNNQDSIDYEIECKLEFCNIVNLCLDLRQEHIIMQHKQKIINHNEGELISFFKNYLEDTKSENNKFSKPDNDRKTPQDETYLFDPLNHLQIDAPSYILNLFNSTENYNLKSELLGIMFAFFREKRTLIKNIKKINIMKKENDIELVRWSKINISILKNLSEQSESICKFWITNTLISEINTEKLETLNTLLEEFKLVMYSDCIIEENILKRNRNKIDPDRQLMLKSLNFHIYVSNIIKNCMYILEDIYENYGDNKNSDSKRRIFNLFQQCFSCLDVFVKKNKSNQKTLFPFIYIYTMNLKINMGQINLVCDIFRGNVELCANVNESLLKMFIDLIKEQGRHSEFLNFFDEVSYVAETPILNNQRIIVKLLTNPEYKDYLCFMKNNIFDFEVQDNQNKIESINKDQPYVYHAKLISVLTKCGSSSNNYQLIKAKCQKIIPIEQIIELLSKEDTYRQLGRYLLDFLKKIYFYSSDKLSYIEDHADSFSELIKKKVSDISSKKIDNTNLELWIDLFEMYIANRAKMSSICYSIKEYIDSVVKNWEYISLLKLSPSFGEKTKNILDFFKINSPEIIIINENHFTQELTELPINLSAKSLKNEIELTLNAKNEEKFRLQESIKSYKREQSKDKQEQNEIDSKEVIESFIEFISKASVFKPPVTVLYEVIKFLAEYIPNADDDSKKIQERKRVQDFFKQCRIIPIILDLLCDKELDRKIFSILITFGIKLLIL